MTVLGNNGYGLRLRGMKREALRRRVTEILHLLSLFGLEDRKVTNLSGGQRQRVAPRRLPTCISRPGALSAVT
jgi:ABC-type sugar transport system ATPase subunit